jgi:ankyrin repeat protein
MYQVTFLIREAIFRPRHLLRKHGRLSLDICSLGELVDMYHAYEATKCHDKVYALLGMSSDDIRVAGLKPNYNNRWSTLLWSLIRFLLNNQASVKTWDDRQMAVIKSKGCILGKVSAVETIIDLGGRQRVEAIFKNLSNQLGCIRDGSARWTLQNSAKSIQNGDFICLLQGASKPTIIRLCKDHFTIIMIAAVPPKSIRTGDGDIDWPRLSQSVPFTRDFLLIWDWEVSSENSQDLGKYDTFIQTTNDRLGYLEALLEGQLDNATRTWNIALIMGDLGEYEKAEERLREGIEGYEIVFGEEHPHTIESQYGLTPLSWAAGNGYSAIVKLLLMKNDVDADLKDSQYGRTPLSWAARSGHEAVVKQLLTTGKAVDVDSKDGGGQTPLSWAAQNGHEAVVKLLLATGKVVDVDSKDEGGQTPLSWAAQNGHEAVVKLLLATGKATIDSEDGGGQTPLWWAAQNGHEAVVKLLLATGKVDVNSKDKWHSRTPMLWAAQNGHEAVVKLFLTTSKATIDSKDRDGQTPLSWAAKNGHGAIVKLLLTTDADVDSNDGGNQTPLSWAAQNGHEAVVRLLLATGKATVDSNDRGCQTPLWWAARYGHEAVVKLLLLTEADVDSKNWDGRTPLSWAAQNGHEAVVKLLLATEADVDSRDGGDQTPLWWAAQNGHEAVVKLLLATGKVDVNSKDKWYGRTPLSWASQNGHKAVVKLLQLASSS